MLIGGRRQSVFPTRSTTLARSSFSSVYTGPMLNISYPAAYLGGGEPTPVHDRQFARRLWNCLRQAWKNFVRELDIRMRQRRTKTIGNSPSPLPPDPRPWKTTRCYGRVHTLHNPGYSTLHIVSRFSCQIRCSVPSPSGFSIATKPRQPTPDSIPHRNTGNGCCRESISTDLSGVIQPG